MPTKTYTAKKWSVWDKDDPDIFFNGVDAKIKVNDDEGVNRLKVPSEKLLTNKSVKPYHFNGRAIFVTDSCGTQYEGTISNASKVGVYVMLHFPIDDQLPNLGIPSKNKGQPAIIP